MPRIVLSASRRTDIPAFYMPWFMSSIKRGYFTVINPYNNRTSRVPAGPEQVHSIVFWSKNFGPFIEKGYGLQLQQMGYGLFFNFTINSVHKTLEPNLPPLEQRLEQLARLSGVFGPGCMNWRFDPICVFKTTSGHTGSNLDQFTEIAGRVADAGVSTCITSFVDPYRKVLRRFDRYSDLTLIDPPLDRKISVITKLAGCLGPLGINLHLCCEKDLLDALPPALPVSAAGCIPSHRLASLYGPDISLARDSGQRKAAGCTCGVSRDIGSYRLHPCRHDCLFCYANPAMDQAPPPSRTAP